MTVPYCHTAPILCLVSLYGNPMLGLVWAFPHGPPYCFRFTLLRDLNLDVFFFIAFTSDFVAWFLNRGKVYRTIKFAKRRESMCRLGATTHVAVATHVAVTTDVAVATYVVVT